MASTPTVTTRLAEFGIESKRDAALVVVLLPLATLGFVTLTAPILAYLAYLFTGTSSTLVVTTTMVWLAYPTAYLLVRLAR